MPMPTISKQQVLAVLTAAREVGHGQGQGDDQRGLAELSMDELAALRWPEDVYLLVLGALSIAAATLGRTARRRRWRWQRWRWIGLHLTGMSASYILLLTAFYVDNGKHLPVWKSLPHLSYWLLPGAVGLPLVARALARYRGLATRRPTHT